MLAYRAPKIRMRLKWEIAACHNFLLCPTNLVIIVKIPKESDRILIDIFKFILGKRKASSCLLLYFFSLIHLKQLAYWLVLKLYFMVSTCRISYYTIIDNLFLIIKLGLIIHNLNFSDTLTTVEFPSPMPQYYYRNNNSQNDNQAGHRGTCQ